MIIDFVSKYFYYVFLALILITVIQRRHKNAADNKRLAVLIAAIMFFIMYIGALGIKSKNLDQSLLLIPLLIDLSLLYVLRNKLFIFKTVCTECGNKLVFQDILYVDSNLCSDCTAKHSDEDSESDETSENEES